MSRTTYELIAEMPAFKTSILFSGYACARISRSCGGNGTCDWKGKPAVVDSPRQRTRKVFFSLVRVKSSGERFGRAHCVETKYRRVTHGLHLSSAPSDPGTSANS